MLIYKTESRVYEFIENQRPAIVIFKYSLEFEGRKLINVRNSFDFSIEKDSECWEFFNDKYNS
jgi:hypothetical protein